MMNSPIFGSKRVGIALASLLFSCVVQAQNMNIISANGTNRVIDLTTIESLVFKNGNMVVKNADCGDQYFSQFFVTNIQVGANAGLNDYTSGTGIQVYPNPVSDQLTGVRNCSGKATVTITGLLGEQVTTFETTDQTFSITLPAMRPGVYFLSVDHQCIKFVKQ